MIKRLFLTVLISFVALNLSAQNRVDGFDSYDAMVGKEIRLYNTVSIADHQGYFVYDIENGKPKVVKNSAIYQELEKNNIFIREVVKHKKNSYLKATLKGKTIYLILNDSFNYLANARSVSYWTEQNDRYVTLYSHLYAGSNIVAGDYERIYPYVVLSKYIPITWCPIASMPENINDEVLFKFTVSGRPMIEFAVSEGVMKMYEADFLQREQFAAEELEYNQHIASSQSSDGEEGITEAQYSQMDGVRIFVADINFTSEAERIFSQNDIEHDTFDEWEFSVFGVTSKTTGYGRSAKTKKYYKGYVLQKEMELPEDAVIFRNSEDKAYIDLRGAEGEDTRRKMALANDIEFSTAALLKITTETEELKERLDRLFAHYRKNNIFILDQSYSYSSWRFGLAFKFFNCFGKEIKYIEITVCAYNQVGDRQRDDIGQHTREARCIGPIPANETATYDFDELFWDDNDIIDKLKVEKIVITFMDNSVRTYSGKAQVDRLRVENHKSPILDEPITVGNANDFKAIISGINWDWTESELINHFGYKVVRTNKETWESEKSESNYSFNGVTICGIPLAMSYIRVNKDTRKIHRINFIVLDDASDLTVYPKIDKALTTLLGTPTKTQKESDSSTLIWEYDDHVIEAKYMDLSDVTTAVVEKYGYFISIEPR